MKPLEYEDFIKKDEPQDATESIRVGGVVSETPDDTDVDVKTTAPEIDVQKAVVEALAEEKVKMEGEMASLRKNLDFYKNEISRLENALAESRRNAGEWKEKCESERKQREILESKEYDIQERNPNSLALLDRDVEIPDRFPGETRDQVINAVEEAWKKAEKEGRIRLAQVLEGVLASNERNGTLEERKKAVREIFTKNLNVLNGEAIAALEKIGISHKRGEEYLTVEEIMAANF